MWCSMCAGWKHKNKTVLGQLNYTYTNNHTSFTSSNGPIELLKNPIIFWRSHFYYQDVLCMPGREHILYINSNQVSLATAKQYSTGAITYSMHIHSIIPIHINYPSKINYQTVGYYASIIEKSKSI